MAVLMTLAFWFYGFTHSICLSLLFPCSFAFYMFLILHVHVCKYLCICQTLPHTPFLSVRVVWWIWLCKHGSVSNICQNLNCSFIFCLHFSSVCNLNWKGYYQHNRMQSLLPFLILRGPNQTHILKIDFNCIIFHIGK